MKKEKSYRYVLYGAYIGSVLLTWSCYRLPWNRLYDSVIDLIFSVWYYFAELFTPESNHVIATVTALPQISLDELLPWNWEAIARKFELLFPSLFDKGYFMAYLQSIANFAHNAAIWITLSLPFVVYGIISLHHMVEN